MKIKKSKGKWYLTNSGQIQLLDEKFNPITLVGNEHEFKEIKGLNTLVLKPSFKAI